MSDNRDAIVCPYCKETNEIISRGWDDYNCISYWKCKKCNMHFCVSEYPLYGKNERNEKQKSNHPPGAGYDLSYKIEGER